MLPLPCQKVILCSLCARLRRTLCLCLWHVPGVSFHTFPILLDFSHNCYASLRKTGILFRNTLTMDAKYGVPQDYCNNGTFLGSLWRPNKMPLQNLVFFWEIPLSGLLVFHHDGSKGIALKQTRQRINSAQGCLSFVYMEFLKHAKTSSLLCYLKNNQPFSNYQIKWKSGYL